MRNRLADILIVAAVAILLTLASQRPVWCDQPQQATSDRNDIAYLIFWPPLPGATSSENFEASIRNFAARLGTIGDGKTRQLGFGASFPIFVRDESRIKKAIEGCFYMARRTNVAVHFNVDDHIAWDERPDLWNWYDPAKPGYNPNNRKNVEWYDWEGTANKRRYFTPNGIPAQTPHMCYNSPAILKEINRVVSQIVGPALREEIDKLKQQHKEYLFAGITIGAEAGIDDYSTLPKPSDIQANPNPEQKQMLMLATQSSKMMQEDNAPRSRLGYCALTNAGYSKAHPPADINRALASINQKFIEYWDKQFYDAGIPRSRLYTHIAAQPAQDERNNAPIWVAFNPYARPGWTTYPEGCLLDGLQPLYIELSKHGNPAWGGVEAHATFSYAGSPPVPWETYLAWQFNHGAKLVGINTGTTEPSLMAALGNKAFNEEAISAYRKFLSGRALTEEYALAHHVSPQQLQQKIHVIQAQAPLWLEHSHRPDLIQPLFMKLDTAVRNNRLEDADKIADQMLKLITPSH